MIMSVAVYSMMRQALVDGVVFVMNMGVHTRALGGLQSDRACVWKNESKHSNQSNLPIINAGNNGSGVDCSESIAEHSASAQSH